MPERPLLILPRAAPTLRHSKGRGFSKIHRPAPARQRDLLEPKFLQLERAFETRRAEIRADPAGAEPESVLVLETVGRVEDFYKAVRGIEGLEWLLDAEEDELEPDEEFYNENDPASRLAGCLYLIMSNQRGLRELLSLWGIFRQDPDHAKFERGRAKWAQLFKHLREIRFWGPQDRLRETGLLEDWRIRAEAKDDRVSVEVELWPRMAEDNRKRATTSVTALIQGAGGTVTDEAYIERIAYHGVLADLPLGAVQSLIEMTETQLVRCDQVMFFRPSGQSVVVSPGDAPAVGPPLKGEPLPTEAEPIIALLDGMPLENHDRLAGRLLVDDPDGWSADYAPMDRHHGTAMASLIVHGELDAPDSPISKRLYIRPIMKPCPGDFRRPRREAIPEDVLPVDLLHRAVKRMVGGEGDQAPVAPSVKVVNLSVGDAFRQFDSYPSPIARLIDYLSAEHGIVFIVSAGNHAGEIELDVPREDFASLLTDPGRLEVETVTAISGQSRMRRLLCPAESINAITVAASHLDSSNSNPMGGRIDPFSPTGMPSPINAQGFGFRRAVKPDILLPGGRQTYREKLGNGHSRATLQKSDATAPPGQSVATPGASPGVLNAVRHTCGTSNATALASRLAGRIYDSIAMLRNEAGGELIENAHIAPLIKTMLVHSAAWRGAREALAGMLGTDSKSALTRLLGYGTLRSEIVFECESHRATLVGCGSLRNEEGHIYTVPLPYCLSGKRVWRRVTITLSWLTPVNCRHNSYRKAELWFAPYGSREADVSMQKQLGVRRVDADWRAVRRGTVQHEIFEGEDATVFGDQAKLEIQVNCREAAGGLGRTSVPYSLVLTVETSEGLGLEVYEEIRTLIRPAVEIRPAQ